MLKSGMLGIIIIVCACIVRRR